VTERRVITVDDIRQMSMREYMALRTHLFAPEPIVTCEDCGRSMLAEDSHVEPLWGFRRCLYCYELALLLNARPEPKRRRWWRR
jgi:hypothetical protein